MQILGALPLVSMKMAINNEGERDGEGLKERECDRQEKESEREPQLCGATNREIITSLRRAAHCAFWSIWILIFLLC